MYTSSFTYLVVIAFYIKGPLKPFCPSMPRGSIIRRFKSPRLQDLVKEEVVWLKVSFWVILHGGREIFRSSSQLAKLVFLLRCLCTDNQAKPVFLHMKTEGQFNTNISSKYNLTQLIFIMIFVIKHYCSST